MESTLAIELPDIVSRLGSELGYGRGPAHLDPPHNQRQTDAIKDCWVSGLRKFYWCGYEWSFLKPLATIDITDGLSTAVLPADFGGFEGKAVIATPTDAVRWEKIDIVLDEDIIAAQVHTPSRTGRPRQIAQTPVKGTQAQRGQRWQALVYPTPDQDYTIRVRYYLLPDALTNQMPFAYGGAQHSECLMEACLAAAEQIRYGKDGVHTQEFQRLLQVSQRLDKRLKPQTLGQNDNGGRWYDPGRGMWVGGNGWRSDFAPVSYNGTVY